MTGRSLVTSSNAPNPPQGPTAYTPLGSYTPPPADEGGVPWGRYIAALQRFKWVILALGVLGTGAGFGATRLIDPVYEARATIWINTSSPGDMGRGPIRAAELLKSIAWVELLRSYAIADTVVADLRLYVQAARPAQRELFATFERTPQFRTGAYVLTTDAAARTWTLARQDGGLVLERGVVGDSVGRTLGFRWLPSAKALLENGEIEFSVMTPREAAVRMLGSLQTQMPEESNFLRMTMSGVDPQRTATTLNALTRQFVASAATIKKRKDAELADILEEQLALSERELHDAEIALETFRAHTITLPTESVPVAGGTEQTRDPVLGAYFEQKTAHDDLRHDRQVLAEAVKALREGRMAPDGLQSIPGLLARSPALQESLRALSEKRAQLRAMRVTFTDQHPTVVQLGEELRVLETQTLPQQAAALLADMSRLEGDMARRIDVASAELRRIPARTIEEMRLRRHVNVSTTLYNTLKGRYEEAKLAEASATPDVSVLDSAVAPLHPTTNTAPRIMLMACLASFGAAIALAILLDLGDRRFRYPAQATHELGLTVMGAVPSMKRGRRGAMDMDAATQAMEAFRSVRFSVRSSVPQGQPVMLTVTSPSPGDGKSLVSSNLALSFAASGERTLLIDGDLRRGDLHGAFGLERDPGLVNLLREECTLEEALRPTTHRDMWVMPCGTRRRRAPELLASPSFPALLERLRAEFDVIIVDTPPLGAGMDPFAIAAATGNMLIVLRAGLTDRKLAESKLRIVDRLPVRVLGAVINDIRTGEGEYKYYSYASGYDVLADGDDEAPLALSGNGVRH